MFWRVPRHVQVLEDSDQGVDALLEMVPDVSVFLRHFCDEAGLAANSIYFCFLLVKNQ